jgi:hypothetical protein
MEIELVSLQRIREIFHTCTMDCRCRTCGHDDHGVCAMGKGDCSEARQLERCPVANCDRYKARDDHGL